MEDFQVAFFFLLNTPHERNMPRAFHFDDNYEPIRPVLQPLYTTFAFLPWTKPIFFINGSMLLNVLMLILCS